MAEQKTIIIDLSNGTTSMSIDLRKDAETLSAKLAEFYNSCARGDQIQISVSGTAAQEDQQNAAQRLARAFGIKVEKSGSFSVEPPFPGAKPN